MEVTQSFSYIERDKMCLAWAAGQGEQGPCSGSCSCTFLLGTPCAGHTGESAENSSKWEDEKSPWVTIWPFSIAEKLRHPRQIITRGFQAKLGTEF